MSGCGKRMKFTSEQQANLKISKAWSGIGWDNRPLPVRSYSCDLCNAWHITSKPLMTRAEQIEAAKKKASL